MLMVVVHDDVTTVWAPHLVCFKLPMYQDALHNATSRQDFISSFGWHTHVSHILVRFVHS